MSSCRSIKYNWNLRFRPANSKDEPFLGVSDWYWSSSWQKSRVTAFERWKIAVINGLRVWGDRWHAKWKLKALSEPGNGGIFSKIADWVTDSEFSSHTIAAAVRIINDEDSSVSNIIPKRLWRRLMGSIWVLPNKSEKLVAIQRNAAMPGERLRGKIAPVVK